MATGFYDANGIWNYGESDNIAPFSDTLNKLADSTSDAFTSDRARLGTLEAGSLSGLIPLAPGSVVVASGSAAVNSLGAVTVTNCTSAEIRYIFSGTYTNYRVLFSEINSAASADYNFNIMNGTSVISSGYYYSGTVVDGASSATLNFAGASNQICGTASDSGDKGAWNMEVIQPYLAAQRTKLMGRSYGWTGTANKTLVLNGHVGSGLADGFRISKAGGTTFSAFIQVFGYND